jgi:hypothetical protein
MTFNSSFIYSLFYDAVSRDYRTVVPKVWGAPLGGGGARDPQGRSKRCEKFGKLCCRMINAKA